MKSFFIFISLSFIALFLSACSLGGAAVKSVPPEEFAGVIADPAVFVIDTHTPEQEHIDGTDAVIPYNEIAASAAQLPADKNTPVAVYCRSGRMSAEAAETLKSMGYSTIYDLKGGMEAWKEAGMDKRPLPLPATSKVTVYKSMSCGCCDLYTDYLMSKSDYDIEVVDLQDTAAIKQKYNIPPALQSCHTIIIGDYFVEGHMPVEAIQKLARERPDIAGIALPEMPSGSPGMPGAREGPFAVSAVGKDGAVTSFVVI